jgi:hypothetical protein
MKDQSAVDCMLGGSTPHTLWTSQKTKAHSTNASWIRTIKSDLADSGISEERLADVTGDVAFSIAAIIDGSRVMQADGQPLIPVLTFAEDSERTKLVVRSGGSSMHEYVHSTVDDIFDEDA